MGGLAAIFARVLRTAVSGSVPGVGMGKCWIDKIGLVLMVLILAAPAGRQRAQAQADHAVPCCGPITQEGEKLSGSLDAMDVESHWLNHQHVNWETGEPDEGEDYTGPGTHTHCSAFAAAAAKRLGVYLLRPPEHGQILLANAQFEWLGSEGGQKAGWRAVSGMEEAQRQANQGNLVLAAYESPNDRKPGHDAIVRPSKRPLETLLADGPELISAGVYNHNKVNARVAFEHHPGAFPAGIRYYEHALK